MELSSRPRHQIRAQGRRRGQAGIVIVESENARLKWHPGGAGKPGSATAVVERKQTAKSSLELLEFLSRTAVQSAKELLTDIDEPKTELEPDSASSNEFRRIIANVQKSDRSAFRHGRRATGAADGRVAHESGQDAVGLFGAASRPAELSEFEELGEFSEFRRFDDLGALGDLEDLGELGDLSDLNYVSDLSQSNPERAFSDPSEMADGQHSGAALRSLLRELNDWLSASNTTGGIDEDGVNSRASAAGTQSPHQSAAANAAQEAVQRAVAAQSLAALTTIPHYDRGWTEDFIHTQGRFGFEQCKDWSHVLALQVADEAGAQNAGASKLSPLLDVARKAVVKVRSLPLGRRIESHENGAVLEKDELGRVTQVRARSGEIISIYYGRDGAPEGFVRTDAKGVLHSVAECDAQGVVLRDENGRVRAAGESLSIDPLGRISICRSDGQYWSIDLARQMLSEKRRLSDQNGKWTALTAVFAADGFRMMTLFQKLSPAVAKPVRSHDEANRIWSSAAVESGHFRFYGRDGSTIEFDSEDGLANLAPANVSSPGVRPIEPRYRDKYQAGTAWQSVHEYVVSYLAV